MGHTDGSYRATPLVLRRTVLRVVGCEPQRRKIEQVRARVRAHVWSLIEARHGRIPPSKVADRDLGRTIVIRLDASLVIAHSDKDKDLAGTDKGTWGHPDLVSSLPIPPAPGLSGSR